MGTVPDLDLNIEMNFTIEGSQMVTNSDLETFRFVSLFSYRSSESYFKASVTI